MPDRDESSDAESRDEATSAEPSGWRQRRAARKEAAKRKPARWWEFPALIIAAIVIAVVIKTFVVQPYYIPSESMEKTLHGCTGCSGDRILVNKPIFHLRDPHPGDIVVFKAPSGWDEVTPQPTRNPFVKVVRGFGQLVGVIPPDEKDLVKRVIAIGGQTVRCCDAQGRVQISENGPNGPWRSLDEPYLFEDNHQPFGPVTVPHGRLWVMGDHRGDSADSRAHCDTGPAQACDPVRSTVSLSLVIGKAVVIAWPPSRWRTLGTPDTFKNTAAAAGSIVPLGSGVVAMFPLLLWRRRRRATLAARACDRTR
ncbi:MAG: signal peptidase I [Jatrophihabitans sp.]